jgi:hypothetical protein
MLDDANRFRQQAEDCRQQEERARTTLDKETWLKLADEWSKLVAASEPTPRA